MSQEKLQTMVMQKIWGVIEVYYGLVQVVNNIIEQSVLMVLVFYEKISMYRIYPCISRPPFLMAKRQFLNFFVQCYWDTNLVFFNFWKCGYTKKSGPQALNSFVVQQLLYMRAFCPRVSKKFSENRTCKPQTNLFRCSTIKGFRG